MKSLNISTNIKSTIFLLALMTFLPYGMQAQRMGHSASRGGGRSMSSKPASRPQTSTRQTQSRQSSNRQSTQTRQAPKKSINGGSSSTRHTTKPSTRPSTGNKATTRPSTSNKKTSDRTKNTNVKNSGNKKNNINSGNKNINIDNSKNINISGNHVNKSSRHYNRPPNHYGGRRYYCHRPYHYHPYRPFYWGPMWHPWGFFVRTITTTAILISINNQAYHYDSGTYYVESNGGYTVVQAPVGATVKVIPSEAEKVTVNETTNNYYYGGDFYEKNADGYTVVPATAGTIVPSLPEGGEEEKIGEITYVKFGEVYYQPIQVDGKDMYEIVEVKQD